MTINHQVNFTRWRAGDLEPEGYRPEGVEYRSPVLQLAQNSLSRKHSPSVLHLGKLRQGFFELISSVQPKLITLEPESVEGDELLLYLAEADYSFDLFVLWDWLFYLPEKHRLALIERVLPKSTPGTSLLCYSSCRQSIPAKPSKYEVKDDFQLNLSPVTTLTTPNHLPDLQRLLTGWRTVRAMQLRNGLREHLFVKS